MSADTQPIAPGRFAAALKDLSIGMLHLKVLEIRNSIAHLQYSNDQLKPFADGTTSISGSQSESNDSTISNTTPTAEPDQDCIEAIKENEAVIERMMQRVALIRAEVEDRGVSWTEFQSKEEVEVENQTQQDENTTTNGQLNGDGQHSAWTDGTFQTGIIRGGQVHLDTQPTNTSRQGGGTLNDEQLRAAMEEQLRQMGVQDNGGDDEDDNNDNGLHL